MSTATANMTDREKAAVVWKELGMDATYKDVGKRYKEKFGDDISVTTIQFAKKDAFPNAPPGKRGRKSANNTPPVVNDGDFVPSGNDFARAKKMAEEFGSLNNLINTLQFLQNLQIETADEAE